MPHEDFLAGQQPQELPRVVEQVVGIGSSAGGLEALQALVGALVPGSGSVFVVAQHLAPEHPSLLVGLLDRATALEVVLAIDGSLLKPDLIIVCPPNRDVVVSADRLRVSHPEPGPGPSPSVDRLLRSISEHWAGRCAGVVLSGTGSDGSRGLVAIKAAHGLTIAQTPASAKFDSMPRAAIATGAVDLVLDPADIAAKLQVFSGEAVPTAPTPLAELLESACHLLRRATGIDFSGYKQTTLARQVSRRMAWLQLGTVEEYLAVLGENPVEAVALKQNLLVTVTSFFRDPEAFHALRSALREYLASRGVDGQVRVWVPGCATGEEVYSVAMVLADLLGDPTDLARTLRIFGTDLDETSLATARRGVFQEGSVAGVPAELRARYLTDGASGPEIVQSLRECTVFARHNVVSDPPFPRLDLVSFRNVLIYLSEPLQQQALEMVGFGLRQGGLLFLGALETVGSATAGWTPVDEAHRIYARSAAPMARSGTIRPTHAWTAPAMPTDLTRLALPSTTASPEHVALVEAMVRTLIHPSLVLDSNHALVEVFGDVTPYCQIPQGPVAAPGSFLRPELLAESRAVLLLSRTTSEPVVSRSIIVEGTDVAVRMAARPLPVGASTMFVLSFVAEAHAGAGATGSPTRDAEFDAEMGRLEHQLLVGQDALHRALAESETANEELQATTEELQAAAEELQASYEELETTNEELHATNEELRALNARLRESGVQVDLLNVDLENIQSSLNQGMVLVDSDLRITRFTPLAVRLFALVDSDLGMPLLSIPTTIAIPGLTSALHAVIGGSERRTLEVHGHHVSYLVQILPYEAGRGRPLGAIITLTDITEVVNLTHEVRFDPLTGQLNRKGLTLALGHELAHHQRTGEPMSLLWIDLDRFKEVNDSHGHDVGDLVLHTIGARLTAVVREDETVGRLGGDEFGVIVTGIIHPDRMDALLERLLAAIREPIVIGDTECVVVGSIGVAVAPQDADAADALMRAADAAMYSAKSAGGDRYAYFEPAMNRMADERRRIRAQVAEAIEGREFQLHYQPIITPEGTPWGAEALLRWAHPDGLRDIGELFTFCEGSGQIRPLGRLIRELLAQDLDALRAAGRAGFPVALNMSVTEMEDPRLAGPLTPTEPAGLDGLVVEVTESVFLPDHSRAMALVDALRAMGTRVSVDDYGTGFSNLRLLKTLAPEFIKLDQTFLIATAPFWASGLDGPQRPRTPLLGHQEQALLKSAIELAHALGAAVVVEGIEDASQRELVVSLGADLLQGHHIARPMPLPALLDWLQEHHPIPPG